MLNVEPNGRKPGKTNMLKGRAAPPQTAPPDGDATTLAQAPGIYNAVLRSDRFGTGHRLGIQNAPAGGPLQITDHLTEPWLARTRWSFFPHLCYRSPRMKLDGMRASARADDCRSERSGTVGSTSESQKAWSSCRSSCSVHGSVLPLLRRSHVERYWLIATEISSSPRQQQARCGAEGAHGGAWRWRRRLGRYR